MKRIKVSMLHDSAKKKLLAAFVPKKIIRDNSNSLYDILKLMTCISLVSSTNIKSSVFYTILDIIASKEYNSGLEYTDIEVEACYINLNRPIKNINLGKLVLRYCRAEDTLVFLNSYINQLVIVGSKINLFSHGYECLNVYVGNNTTIIYAKIEKLTRTSLNINFDNNSSTVNIKSLELSSLSIRNCDKAIAIKAINDNNIEQIYIRHSMFVNTCLVVPINKVKLLDLIAIDSTTFKNIEIKNANGKSIVHYQTVNIKNRQGSIIYDLSKDKVYCNRYYCIYGDVTLRDFEDYVLNTLPKNMRNRCVPGIEYFKKVAKYDK